LTEVVLAYTTKLAEANNVEFEEPVAHGDGTEDGAVVDLRRYLEVQRRIFGEAA